MDEKQRYGLYVREVDEQLDQYLPEGTGTGPDSVLQQAMRYSVFAGGKRIRPVLALAFCEACGGERGDALAFACSLEMIHTYSLIYDDFPCMDNDNMRRGKPTNHVVYGQAMALMAGMGLYSRSFEILTANSALSQSQRLRGVAILSAASGSGGIVGGQVLDLANDGRRTLGSQEVFAIHKMKTSAMFEAAAMLGCVAANASGAAVENARLFAENIGIAFQIRDDILDVTGDAGILGKTTGKDKAENKTTFVDILGLEAAQKSVKAYSEKALSYLDVFQDNNFLRYIADFLCSRNH